MNLSAREKLHRFYGRFSGDDHVLIIINADPDALASAMAVKRLLWRKSASVTIGHVNVIHRPDNLAMIGLLGVDLLHVDQLDPRGYTRIVLVDSQPSHHEAFERLAPQIIIDHHPDTGVSAEYADIRPAYGATASILTEYLKTAQIKPSGKLATALMHAIKTDTNNFQRQTLIEDLRAFQFLFKHANIALARRIEQADLRTGYLRYFKKAIEAQRIRQRKIFSHLGRVPNPDICVLIADFFMRIDSIHWSIVSGLFDKKLIIILRNDGLRKNAGRMAQEGFGSLGSAGGHKSAARAEIPLAVLKDIIQVRDTAAVTQWIINHTEKPRKNDTATRQSL
jgi:nanoRNase/pAp phosphatase (c-di-AMP/oligoRNAs hydrolase)